MEYYGNDSLSQSLILNWEMTTSGTLYDSAHKVACIDDKIALNSTCQSNLQPVNGLWNGPTLINSHIYNRSAAFDFVWTFNTSGNTQHKTIMGFELILW